MAKFSDISFTGDENTTRVLMVSHAVGAKAANFWTDIQLVQYMIASIYLFHADGAGEWSVRMSNAELAALPNPYKDFKALTKTTELIRRFQSDCVKQGLPSAVDGRMDPAEVPVASRTKTAYSILIANGFLISAFQDVFGEMDQEGFMLQIMVDPDLPPLVKGELQASLKALGD